MHMRSLVLSGAAAAAVVLAGAGSASAATTSHAAGRTTAAVTASASTPTPAQAGIAFYARDLSDEFGSFTLYRHQACAEIPSTSVDGIGFDSLSGEVTDGTSTITFYSGSDCDPAGNVFVATPGHPVDTFVPGAASYSSN